MKNLLTTSYQIREALETNYDFIKEMFDPLARGRKLTKDAREMFKGCNRICAICGRPQETIKLEIAHIVPLAECGTTIFKNLVRLCSFRKGFKRDRGCHELFDEGYAAKAEVQKARTKWVDGKFFKGLREKIQERYSKHTMQPANISASSPDFIQSLITSGKVKKAFNEAHKKAEQADGNLDRIRYRIKTIEILRRRTAAGTLEQADRDYRKLEVKRDLPNELISWFYYEGGYIAMLLGQHERALALFKKSQNNVEDVAAWVAATGLIVQTKIALKGAESSWPSLFKLIRQARQRCSKADNIHAKRWIDNLNWHEVRIKHISRDIKGASKALEKARLHWSKMTVLDGWDAGSSSTHRIIIGSLLADRAAAAMAAHAPPLSLNCIVPALS